MTPPKGNALVSFRGETVDGDVAALMSDPRVAGVTLYRKLNVRNAAQTRALIDDLIAAAGRPLLIAIDQEGGQLLGAGDDTTPFAGNMALGAVADTDLTARVASAIGTELRALGINIDLAPVADVASRPYNPSMGIRSFGENPEAVCAQTASFVSGLQARGVAAILKHFPGKGEAAIDPHHALPVLDLDLDRLDSVEFAPFRAGFAAGAQMLMVGHYGLPAVTGDRSLPTSVSSEVMGGLVRDRLGFDGVIVTDALDMGGYGNLPTDAPLEAGADLLLYGPAQAGELPSARATASTRLDGLHGWLDSFDTPELDVVGSDEHRGLASELAKRSITLVRDSDGLLPLRPGPDTRILAIMPHPTNLTPADTSEEVAPLLAPVLRRRHPQTTEFLVDYDTSADQIAEAVRRSGEHDLVVVGTLDASPGQADLLKSVLATGTPTVAVAMRTPYDLASYPQAPTYLCSYGILEPTVTALVDALFGEPITGRLPVALPGLYPAGHGIAAVRTS